MTSDEERTPQSGLPSDDEIRRNLYDRQGRAIAWEGRLHHRSGRPIEPAEVPDEPVVRTGTDLPWEVDLERLLKAPDSAEKRVDTELERLGQWLIRRQGQDRSLVASVEEEAKARSQSRDQEPHRDLPYDVDPHDLGRARWGVVALRSTWNRIGHELRPLLRQRQEQMGLPEELVPLWVEREEVDSATRFLARLGESHGVINPTRVPYYLLIVGGPEEISWDFQYQLAVDHAVGRIAFDDPLGYGRYAQAVVRAEREGSRLSRQASIFSVENDGDQAADLLIQYLTRPLLHDLRGHLAGWDVELRARRRAGRDDLRRLFSGGPESPGLLLVSCHGGPVDFRLAEEMQPGEGVELQRDLQGMLYCQKQGTDQESFFRGSDVPADADLVGQMSFLFACYGAGTPVVDNYPSVERPGSAFADEPRVLAPEPFVARLPQELLERGSLGVVGHVDRGWTFSFALSVGDRLLSAVGSLEDAVKQLMAGARVGHALRPLHRRGLALSAALSRVLDRVRQNVPVDPVYLAELWIQYNDARNFVLLGDPAAYLLGQRRAGELVSLPLSLAQEVRREAEDRGVPFDACVREALEAWLNAQYR